MKAKFLLPTLITAGLSLQAGASVVFSENFDNTTGNNQPLADYGWQATYGASATAYDVSDANNSGGNDGNDKPLVSGAASSEGSTPGYIFQNPFRNNPPIFIFTDGLNLGQQAGVDDTLAQVDFALRNTNTSHNIQIALEIGAGNWFLGDTTFNNTTSNVWSALSLTIADETWKSLTLTVGSELSVGSAVTLPAGDLTGIGFYTANAGNLNNVRIDTLSVTAVPEPSTYAALAGALALGMVMWRRRQR